MYSRYDEKDGAFGVFIDSRTKIMVGNSYDDKVILELSTVTALQICKAIATNDTAEFVATYAFWDDRERKTVRVQCTCSMNINGISVVDQMMNKTYAVTFNELDKQVVKFVFKTQNYLWILTLSSIANSIVWSLGQTIKSQVYNNSASNTNTNSERSSQNTPQPPKPPTPPTPPKPPTADDHGAGEVFEDDDLPF